MVVSKGDSEHEPSARQTVRMVANAAILALLWLVLAEGEMTSLVVGVPVIAAAAVLSVLSPPLATRVRPLAAVRFSVVFLGRCFVAGIDVARRAFGPRGAIAPGLVEYRLVVDEQPPRALLANVVSLLPGTMSVAVEGDVLRLHVLDTRIDVVGDVAALERLVAAVFSPRTRVPEREERDL